MSDISTNIYPIPDYFDYIVLILYFVKVQESFALTTSQAGERHFLFLAPLPDTFTVLRLWSDCCTVQQFDLRVQNSEAGRLECTEIS